MLNTPILSWDKRLILVCQLAHYYALLNVERWTICEQQQQQRATLRVVLCCPLAQRHSKFCYFYLHDTLACCARLLSFHCVETFILPHNLERLAQSRVALKVLHILDIIVTAGPTLRRSHSKRHRKEIQMTVLQCETLLFQRARKDRSSDRKDLIHNLRHLMMHTELVIT